MTTGTSLSDEFLKTITDTIEQACRLLNSLYDSGDLSTDQYDPIAAALLGASELRKEVDRLRQRVKGLQADSTLQASWGRGLDD